jgi:TetR/AcrR family transcriptional regulator
MARPRAANYDDRRREILKIAASLFARQGYDRTSMTEIAQALGVSKALFYHYYTSKDALLYDILREHLTGLAEAAEGADDPDLAPSQRLRAVVAAILDWYKDADDTHNIQLTGLPRLPADQAAEVKALQRRAVDVIARILMALNPRIAAGEIKPITMSVFGTLNWQYMWFREGGAMSRTAYADLVTRLFVDGVAGLAQEHAQPVSKARRA